jgi:hypothetical protein
MGLRLSGCGPRQDFTPFGQKRYTETDFATVDEVAGALRTIQGAGTRREFCAKGYCAIEWKSDTSYA